MARRLRFRGVQFHSLPYVTLAVAANPPQKPELRGALLKNATAIGRFVVHSDIRSVRKASFR
jgi:hypothetical protein